MNEETKYFHAFNLIDSLGPMGFKKLLTYFPSLEQAWSAGSEELKQAGLGQSVLEELQTKKNKINPDREIEKLAHQKINLITLEDENYPPLLKEIYNPPALLYLKGQFNQADEFSLGIVGTRTFSAYGQQVTPLMAADLCKAGLTIVSGLAKGIDTLAHQAALRAGGRTIAVLGSGISDQSIYPRVNKALAQEISQQGAVVSEFPPATISRPQYFPQRNRIIAGLSLGVLIIEAPEKSGALITAREALDQNREVFAIPGSIFSQNSSGANNLIKMGAKLVSQANDILEELNLTLLTDDQNKQIVPQSPEEALVLEQLSNEPLHIDKIIIQTKLSPATINSLLALMEMKGQVRNLGRSNYVLAH